MLRFDVVSALPRDLPSMRLEVIAQVLTKNLRLKKACCVSLRFVSLAVMQKLNKEQRKKDHPTDVLSFATSDAVTELTPKGTELEKGDVIICPAYAAKEAKRRGMDLQEELVRLIIHGVMHIHGYDHITASQEAEMFGLQEKMVEACLKNVISA